MLEGSWSGTRRGARALPAAGRRGRPDRRARVGRDVRAARAEQHVAAEVVGCTCAATARRRRRASSCRCCSPTCRCSSAGAARPRSGSPDARAARRRRRPADRRLRRVGRPAPGSSGWRSLRAHRRLGHRLGADPRVAARARAPLAGDRRRPDRVRGPEAQAHLLAGWLRRGSGTTSRSSTRRPVGSRPWRSTARPSRRGRRSRSPRPTCCPSSSSSTRGIPSTKRRCFTPPPNGVPSPDDAVVALRCCRAGIGVRRGCSRAWSRRWRSARCPCRARRRAHGDLRAGAACCEAPATGKFTGEPTWSPGGRRIRFTSDRASGGARRRIYVMDASGGRCRS